MSQWPSRKAKRVLAALFKLGWQLKRQTGSHRTLAREGWPDIVFAFHDGEELGPRMLARIAKHTGLTPEDHATFFWNCTGDVLQVAAADSGASLAGCLPLSSNVRHHS